MHYADGHPRKLKLTIHVSPETLEHLERYLKIWSPCVSSSASNDRKSARPMLPAVRKPKLYRGIPHRANLLRDRDACLVDPTAGPASWMLRISV